MTQFHPERRGIAGHRRHGSHFLPVPSSALHEGQKWCQCERHLNLQQGGEERGKEGFYERPEKTEPMRSDQQSVLSEDTMLALPRDSLQYRCARITQEGL